MNNLKLTLSLLAVLLALVSIGSTTDFTNITNIGYDLNSDIPHVTIEVNQCDKDLSTGVQCLIQIGTSTVGAFQRSSAVKLFRP